MISLRKWRPGPKSGPKMDPFGGAQVLRKAMNSKGFGAFWPPRGIQFWDQFWTSGFRNFPRIFREMEEPDRGNDYLEGLKSRNPRNN